MDVSIIIINYKTYQLSCNCINSILKFVTDIDFEIILVENGTNEFNNENVAQWGGIVKLVVSKDNLGFAGGNNLGIEKAKGEYILLLNSDTYLLDNAISTTLTYLKNNPKAGVVSAKLIYPDGRVQSVAQRFPSVKYQLIELCRFQKLLGKKRAGRLLLGAFFDFNESVKADWVWGAYFMFPSRILQELPGYQLDDRYFMYYEDMQWCMDISKLGYEIHFCADAVVVHLLGASSANKNEMMIKNGELFLSRNFSPLNLKLIKKISSLLNKS